MALPLFKERRFSRREQLTGLMPGKLYLRDSKTDIVVKPVDVSENGIGVVLNQALTVGAKIVLEYGERRFDLEVSYVTPDFGKNDLYRHGLVCSTAGVNLIEVFRAAGCIKA